MFLAQEKSRSEYLKLTQEKEQQESLALEELELQKKAILSESENKLQELGREAEAYRTVSSCAVWAPEPGTMVSMGTVPGAGEAGVYGAVLSRQRQALISCWLVDWVFLHMPLSLVRSVHGCTC